MQTKITLSEFEGQALSDMNTLNAANLGAVRALEVEIKELDAQIDERQAKVDALTAAVSDRERKITDGIRLAHKVDMPKAGLKLDRDKEGRYVMSWETARKKATRKPRGKKKAKKK